MASTQQAQRRATSSFTCPDCNKTLNTRQDGLNDHRKVVHGTVEIGNSNAKRINNMKITALNRSILTHATLRTNTRRDMTVRVQSARNLAANLKSQVTQMSADPSEHARVADECASILSELPPRAYYINGYYKAGTADYIYLTDPAIQIPAAAKTVLRGQIDALASERIALKDMDNIDEQLATLQRSVPQRVSQLAVQLVALPATSVSVAPPVAAQQTTIVFNDSLIDPRLLGLP